MKILGMFESLLVSVRSELFRPTNGNTPKKLEKELAAAKLRLSAAGVALSRKHKGGEMEAARAAHQEVLCLERSLADSKGESHAVPCDFPVAWDVGAPLPYLFKSDNAAFLTFYSRTIQNDGWDGRSVKIVAPSSTEICSICLVKFKSCASAKLGHPNDEVLCGHPLYGRGLEGYTAQIVKNSPWLKEVAKTNSVHSNDKPQRWSRVNHYIFWFHDSTFECLAESYEIEMHSGTMREVLSRCGEQLLK